MSCCKLNPVALGAALGVIWGISLLILGLVATWSVYGHPFVAAVGTVYVGYTPTIMGSIIGGIIGFVDAFIDGFLIGWLYNVFNKCCKGKGCGCGCSCCGTTSCEKPQQPSSDTE